MLVLAARMTVMGHWRARRIIVGASHDGDRTVIEGRHEARRAQQSNPEQ
jgi:hypothetical protein